MDPVDTEKYVVRDIELVRLVSAGDAEALLDLATSKGADPTSLAERSDLPIPLLDNPGARIPFRASKALMLNAKDLCNAPAFGRHFGEDSRFADMSIVGLICQSAETIGGGLPSNEPIRQIGN
jgi:hypothetical protein